jgi:hypothetical protein
VRHELHQFARMERSPKNVLFPTRRDRQIHLYGVKARSRAKNAKRAKGKATTKDATYTKTKNSTEERKFHGIIFITPHPI